MGFERKSPRLKIWDYTNPSWYFVTICTANHKELFGSVEEDKLKLNSLGKIADFYWNEIPKHYATVELDDYVIMPNHIQGIIIINDIPQRRVEACLNPTKEGQKHSLGNIIGSFKSVVTKWARINGYSNFEWQRSFYDRIIRNEKELYRIRTYIRLNPLQWEFEKNTPENLEI